MKVFLLRHGQTTGDVEDRYGGDYDDHLTELGRAQAEDLARQLVDKDIEVIFTSPRLRALETAEILKEKLKVEVQTIDDFRERNQNGIMTGMVRAEAKEKYPQLVELLKDPHNTVEGGEDYHRFGQRIESALNEVKNSGFSTIAVVTHGGPIRYFFRDILPLGEIEIGDCAWAEVVWAGNQYQIRSLQSIKVISDPQS